MHNQKWLKGLLAIFAGSHIAALFLWVDVSLAVLGRKPSFSPPPLCCAAVGLSHSDGGMRGGKKKHSNVDISQRCNLKKKKEREIGWLKRKQNVEVKLLLRLHSNIGWMDLCTVWTKKKELLEKIIHSEVQGYTPAEWRGRECLDLEMWVRLILDRMTADCLYRNTETERERDWEEKKGRKTEIPFVITGIYHYFPISFLTTKCNASLMFNLSINRHHSKKWMNHLLL